MSVSDVDLALDRRLSEVSGMLPMLQLLTPINVTEQKKAFFERRVVEPEFTYRDLPDLRALGAELGAINPEEATDPVLVHMIRGMHQELERRIELLGARNTDRFLLAAIEKWGHVDQTLLELAERVLEEVPPGPPADEYVHAHELAGMATIELDHYRKSFPELATLVHVSELAAGVMVENGDLFISTETSISSDRVVQLLHHEIGVHVLTFVNGSVQPIRMLSLGLEGYEETQEALGVLAEYLGGGLLPKRLRTFALRVMAAQSVSSRDSFAQTYELMISLGAGRNRAFNTTMRAHRSGGMTKDALYLGGITRLLTFIQEGGDLDSLLVGKISLADGPLVVDLLERKVLVEPPLRPRFLDSEQAPEQLARIEDGAGVLELVGIAA
ncbi:MAG TPA: tyrosine/phenylalanine carboxypeptidase domain-containing protein [Acidimicrobiia bacterium]|nr:tyrosine/phenylalanine carboxypeptidase domain-containing protein [Acidimicrobiia bacterium]